MTENELLLAISNIIEAQVGPLKNEMTELRRDVRGLKQDVEGLKQDVEGLKQDIEGLKQDVHSLDQRVQILEQKQQHMSLILENDVLPRLQTIEACYTSTYERYAAGIADLDDLKADMVIVKKVLAEHRDRLQKIS